MGGSDSKPLDLIGNNVDLLVKSLNALTYEDGVMKLDGVTLTPDTMNALRTKIDELCGNNRICAGTNTDLSPTHESIKINQVRDYLNSKLGSNSFGKPKSRKKSPKKSSNKKKLHRKSPKKSKKKSLKRNSKLGWFNSL